MGVACRRPTLRPLDDGLSALHDSLPHRTRSTGHRCDQRHGLSRLPEGEGTTPAKSPLQQSPLGDVHLAGAEVHTAAGRLSLVGATERASQLACAERHAQATRRIAANFRRALSAAVPDKRPTVWTANGTQFTELTPGRHAADQREAVQQPAGFSLLQACDDAGAQAGSEPRLTKPGPPWTNGQVERLHRTLQEATVKRDAYATHQQLQAPLDNVLKADNCAKRRKPLHGLTPDAYVVNCWQREPERVTVTPCHHTLGLNR
jgi:Integrase core domain